MSTTSTPTTRGRRPTLGKRGDQAADFLDTRVGAGALVKEFARKAFPDHWSFELGQMALWSFVTLLITGVFLTMFFVPSMGHTTYPEDALPETMQGVPMSEAFASTVYMSFEVPGGLLMRQMHHWAALLFMASIVVHMFRVFFTGAFRKPREVNWLIGFALLILGLAAGFTGYSLPDDVLSGNGLRIADGVLRAVPIIGAHASYALFGGEFPGTEIIPRLFTAHILLVPGLILALVSVHLVLVVVHKHTQYPGPGRTNRNVVGLPLFPSYAAKAGGFFFIVFGLIAVMGATMSINAVWNYGPYDPSPVGAGAQPDWYMLFLEGSLRLMPSWEWVVAGYTIPLSVLIPGIIVPGLLFTPLAVWPFIEAAATRDKSEHHVLDRPRNRPVRTAIGVVIIGEFVILAIAGSNDLVATHFDVSLNDVTYVLRAAFLLWPILGFVLTKRICLSLQRRDRELALHGHETGRIVQMPDGKFMEVHKPLSDDELWTLVSYSDDKPAEIAPETDERGVHRPDYKKDKMLARLSRFFYEDRVAPVTPAELAVARSHAHGEVEPAAAPDRLEAGASVPGAVEDHGDQEEYSRGGSVATVRRSAPRD